MTYIYIYVGQRIELRSGSKRKLTSDLETGKKERFLV